MNEEVAKHAARARQAHRSVQDAEPCKWRERKRIKTYSVRRRSVIYTIRWFVACGLQGNSGDSHTLPVSIVTVPNQLVNLSQIHKRRYIGTPGIITGVSTSTPPHGSPRDQSLCIVNVQRKSNSKYQNKFKRLNMNTLLQ